MAKKVIAMLLLLETLGLPTIAFAKEKTPETQGNLTDYQLKRQDVEFATRSQRGEDWLFHEIPRDLGYSVKESFWGWGGLAFGLGAGATAVIYPFDDDIQKHLGHHAWFGYTGDDIIGDTFSPYTLAGASVLTWIAGAAAKSPKAALTGRALTESLALSMALTGINKLAFQRERPNGGNFSFSSAHSAAAFSTASVLTVFYGWKAALPSYAMATLVGMSRLDANEHFLSDVVMGAVIGTVFGIGTAKFHRHEHPNLFIVPEVTHEHASLQLHYQF